MSELRKEIMDSIGLSMKRTDMVGTELAEFKAEVAKTYMPKEDARGSFDQVMEGIREIRADVRAIHGRVDTIIRNPPQ